MICQSGNKSKRRLCERGEIICQLVVKGLRHCCSGEKPNLHFLKPQCDAMEFIALHSTAVCHSFQKIKPGYQTSLYSQQCNARTVQTQVCVCVHQGWKKHQAWQARLCYFFPKLCQFLACLHAKLAISLKLERPGQVVACTQLCYFLDCVQNLSSQHSFGLYSVQLAQLC